MKPNLQKMVQSLMEVGVTQRQIAKEVGVSQPTISHIYHEVFGSERPQYATVANLIKVAEKHGVRMDGTKVAKIHRRGSWKPMPPAKSTNKYLQSKETSNAE